MKKEELEFLINESKSTREIATILKTSQTNVRYWLNKFELKTKAKNLEIRPSENTRICPMCKIEKELILFYQRRKKVGNSPYCKSCSIQKTIIRQQQFKLKCMEYKGGKCVKCNYNKCQSSLCFHHIDETTKEFSIDNRVCNGYAYERLVKEVDKCILLCQVCHEEEHNPTLINENWIQDNTI